MIIRKTRLEDLDEVMRIYERAVRYMAETGNPNQWAVGYPTRAMITEDIAGGVSYVLDADGVIEAVFAYIEGEDPTYARIENGAWRSNGRYGTIHRIASAGRMKGVAGKCFAWCEGQVMAHGLDSLRVDTHNDNRIMQHVVIQFGFVYCGTIYLANGAPRLAYEKVLRKANYSMPNYNAPNDRMYDVRQKQKGDGTMLGILSMVLGVVSLLLFCSCINFLFALVAIILGIVQIVKNKDKEFAIVGIVTSVISMLLAIILYITLAVGAVETDMDPDEFYDSYYDGEYDDYFEEEGSAEFL